MLGKGESFDLIEVLPGIQLGAGQAQVQWWHDPIGTWGTFEPTSMARKNLMGSVDLANENLKLNTRFSPSDKHFGERA